MFVGGLLGPGRFRWRGGGEEIVQLRASWRFEGIWKLEARPF